MIPKYLIYTLFSLFLIITGCGTSQQIPNQESANTITVDATGEVLAPADEIIFNINITRFDEEASEAFNNHKELEQFLTELIIDQNIDEEHINANPISISSRRHSQNPGFETRQNVAIRLQDLSQFESMQITLVENGFDNFSANFSTTSIEEAHQEALTKAVDEAKKKAESLVTSSGKELGEVYNIEYTSSSGIVYRDMAMMSAESYGGSLIEMQRTIPVRENVRVRFRIH